MSPVYTVLATPVDTADDAAQTTFQTDRRNRFKSYVLSTDLPEGAGGLGTATPGSSIEPTYDSAGNCTFDGRYFYQYDAWNRLVQVNKPKPFEAIPDGAAALVLSNAGLTPSVAPGALVKHFTYDALGRLIRTQSPFPNPADADGSVRTERFYYDGIRRIQAVVVDPVQVIDLEGGDAGDAGDGDEIPAQLSQMVNQYGGDGSAAAIAGQSTSASNVDGSTSTSSFEQAQIELNPANGQGGGSGGSSNLTGGNVGGIELSNATLAREYVWGPGGSFVGAAVDELLLQIDGDGRASWVMQDAGGDVVALAVHAVSSTGGAANGSDAVAANGVNASNTGTNLSFRVAAQQEYDAYGQVIWAEHLLNHAALHLGHKGLFVDRLDVGVGNGSGTGGNGNAGAAACAKTFGEPPRIAPLAFNIAQNRNRTLHTSWGRYLQQDPNASGCNVASMAIHLGMRPGARALNLDLDALYADSPNIYAYCQFNSFEYADPLGLTTAWMAPMAPGIAGALLGAAMESAFSLANGDDWGTVGRRAARGAIVGGVSGGMGGFAFASSAGLFGSLAARGAYAGAVGGFASGSLSTGLNGGSLAEQFANGFFNAALGGALGYASGAISSRFDKDPVLRGFGVSRSSPYGHLEDPPNVGPGKDFTSAQRAKIIQENMKRHNGIVISDESGTILTAPQKSQRGVTPDPNEWQIDHIIPKHRGGSNSYTNARVLSRYENWTKGID